MKKFAVVMSIALGALLAVGCAEADPEEKVTAIESALVQAEDGSYYVTTLTYDPAVMNQTEAREILSTVEITTSDTESGVPGRLLGADELEEHFTSDGLDHGWRIEVVAQDESVQDQLKRFNFRENLEMDRWCPPGH